MKGVNYFELAIEEILEMIKENIFVYLAWGDETFVKLRKYCVENYDNAYKNLSYDKLLSFTKEVLEELIDCPFLYDFRPLE